MIKNSMKIIDIHTHGICGYDTRTTTVEHILKIAEIHGSYGVSAIIPAIYPASISVMRENMEVIKKAMERQNKKHKMQDARCKIQDVLAPCIRHPKPAKILGVHLEGPFLNPTKCGALDSASFIKPTEYNFKKLIEGFENIVKIITIAPEIKGATTLIKKMSDMGIIASMGHSDATYTEAEAGFNAGAKGITHVFNAMRGFHHRDPGIAGFGLLNKEIYIEVVADPYHLHPKTLDLIFKIKNPERIIIVSDTVKEAKTKKGQTNRLHVITDIYGKLSGGSMTIAESSERLVKMGYDKTAVINCITKNPERYLSASF
ncbi:MAG: amidohydrolase family protein [Nitrospirota bacterium]